MKYVDLGGGNSESYKYDGHGRRTSVLRTAGTTTQFYSRNGQLLYERGPAGNVTQHFYLGNRLIATRAVGTTVYQHTDTLGSIVKRTNASQQPFGGAVPACEPYGSLGNANASYEQRPGFTGHMTDAATTLSYMQQRYYDPLAMRFLSVAPVAASTTDGSNFNRYWYGNDNPYKYTDSDGRLGCTGTHIQRVCDSGRVAGMMTSARASDMQRQAQNHATKKMGQAVRAAGQAVASGAKATAEAVIPGVGCLSNGCSGGEWVVEAATLIPLAKIARVLENAVDAGATIFKTTHYSSRLESVGIDAARAESIVAREVAAIRGNMAVGGDVAGRLRIDNVLVEYRARLLPDGSVNVGTIFPVKP